ncbi:putative transcription factor C2H2 family [Helianthus annuus]|nr:putative transcription factor C2H2 family [Helianthus annuus]
MESRYSIFVTFDGQNSTDAFHKHLMDGASHLLRFLLFTESCRVLFTVDVQYTHLIEHTQTSLASTEQPSCPVFNIKPVTLDQDMSGILMTMCNHSFHCSCISKWTDSSCPVSILIYIPSVLYCLSCHNKPTNCFFLT